MGKRLKNVFLSSLESSQRTWYLNWVLLRPVLFQRERKHNCCVYTTHTHTHRERGRERDRKRENILISSPEQKVFLRKDLDFLDFYLVSVS